MAAGRLQRWATFLGGFNYTFRHVKGSLNGGADGLSRLPLQSKEQEDCEELKDYFNFFVEEKLPVDAKMIRKAIRTDRVLSKVLLYTMTEWPKTVEDVLKPFHNRKEEISIDNGLLFWGYRIIIPEKHKSDILDEVHATHLGASKMKTLARQYFWYPKLDSELEKLSKSCDVCCKNADNPNRALLLKFEEAKQPLERIHADFLGPFKGNSYLIITDSYSKWPEIYEMKKCDAVSTIENLRDYCARYGLPKKLITDNGTQFTAEEFQLWTKTNGIKHVRTSPAHPSTNGAAENAVRSFKNGFKKVLDDKKNINESKATLIARYLLYYRMTPHSTTGESPAKRMIGREIRNRLDLLRESRITETNENRQIENYSGKREVYLVPNEIVYVRDYRIQNKPGWKKAKVVKALGPRNYLCRLIDEENLIWKRHIDQIIKTETFVNEELGENVRKEQLESKNVTDNLQNVIPEIKEMIETQEKVEHAAKSEERESARLMNEFKNNTEVKENASERVEVKNERLTPRKVESSKTVIKNPTVALNINERPKRTIKKPDRLNL